MPPPYDKAAAIALLDSFATSDEYGTAEEQRETFAYPERIVDEDRPGQRSVFGKGYNPPANVGRLSRFTDTREWPDIS